MSSSQSMVTMLHMHSIDGLKPKLVDGIGQKVKKISNVATHAGERLAHGAAQIAHLEHHERPEEDGWDATGKETDADRPVSSDAHNNVTYGGSSSSRPPADQLARGLLFSFAGTMCAGAAPAGAPSRGTNCCLPAQGGGGRGAGAEGGAGSGGHI